MRLGRIGLDNIAGYLDGGIHVLESQPELVETTSRITATALHEQLSQTNGPVVIDVRSEQERLAEGFIAGSIHIPLNHLEEQLADLPDHQSLVVHCAGGYRSVIACSILQKYGLPCQDMAGGFKAWTYSRLPVSHEQMAASR